MDSTIIAWIILIGFPVLLIVGAIAQHLQTKSEVRKNPVKRAIDWAFEKEAEFLTKD